MCTVGAGFLALAFAWERLQAGKGTTARIACFDATSAKTSPGTRAVFEARHCQGGGVTWAAILHALLERRGVIAPVLGAAPGGVPELPPLLPVPVLGGEARRAVEASFARLRETIRKQPVWCFPGDGSFDGATGSLRFTPDDRVIHTPARGRTPREGAVTWADAKHGDDRLQITVPNLLHLDVGDTGRLGRAVIPTSGPVARQELVPGDGCLRSQ